MCGPRQLFFFQCGPETPKGWTPLLHSALPMRPHCILKAARAAPGRMAGYGDGDGLTPGLPLPSSATLGWSFNLTVGLKMVTNRPALPTSRQWFCSAIINATNTASVLNKTVSETPAWWGREMHEQMRCNKVRKLQWKKQSMGGSN